MRTQQLPLHDAIHHYDRNQDAEHLAEGERQRTEILQRFPLDAWPTLTLEQYALGQLDSTDTHCRWLELGSRQLGLLANGSARKEVLRRLLALNHERAAAEAASAAATPVRRKLQGKK